MSTEFGNLLPHWATGFSSTPVVGSQLCTRDGRKFGNAVIFSATHQENLGIVFTCVTDVGGAMFLTEKEILEGFYPLELVMNPKTHPGVIRLENKGCVSLTIKTCTECPNISSARHYTQDSFENLTELKCKKIGKIIAIQEFNDAAPKIPEWCPIRCL